MSGWETGQTENQVELVRERFFTRRLPVPDYSLGPRRVEYDSEVIDKAKGAGVASNHPDR